MKRKPSKLDAALAEIERLKQEIERLKHRAGGPKPTKYPWVPPPYPVYPNHPGWRNEDHPDRPRPRPYWLPDITCHA